MLLLIPYISGNFIEFLSDFNAWFPKESSILFELERDLTVELMAALKFSNFFQFFFEKKSNNWKNLKEF